MATSGHGDNLKIDDLKDVISALWDARAKWRNIGSCIGVDQGTLDTMKGKDGDCLNGILSHWLRGVHNPKQKNSKPRTWRTLIEALREKVVNEEAMANKLEKEKYPDTNPDQHCTPPEPDVAPPTHSLTFSSSMSDEDFFKWLRSKGISDKDCKALSDSGITPSGFPLCDVEDFDDIELTKIGKKLFLRIFTEVKGIVNQSQVKTRAVQYCSGPGQYGDQQPSERDRSHDGSRDHTPQYSDKSNESTINDRSTSATRLNDSDHSGIYNKLKGKAADWRNIGKELGFNQGEMNNIQSRPMLLMQAPESFLSEMLSQWLQWAPQDGRGSKGFATRESLRAALLRANLGQLAQQFQ